MERKKGLIFSVILPYAALLAAAAFIFFNSLHTGSSSNALSEKIARLFSMEEDRTGFHIDLSFLAFFYPDEAKDLPNLFVRKLAHFGEYFLFGLVAAFSLHAVCSQRGRRAALYLSFAVGPLVALLDEKVVQAYLSRGRTALFRDVLLDSCGYLAGLFLVLAVRQGKGRRLRQSRIFVRR